MICPNCKVKLKEGLNQCPLCGELVDIQNKRNNSYSSDMEYFPENLGIVSFLKTIIPMLVIGSIITLICNLAINHTLTWSLIVVCSSLYLGTHYLYLTLSNKILAFMINTFTIELLLLSIAYIANGYHWYLCLVMPFILMSSVYVIISYYLYRKKNILRSISYKAFYLSICLIGINGFIRLFSNHHFSITWAVYAAIPVFIISVLLFILSFNDKIALEIEKRMFV